MNWLEIISVHTAGPLERAKVMEICGKIRILRMSGRSAKLKVYGGSFNTELSIRIQWISQAAPEGKSPLGCALSRALSDFGLVSHTLWIEYDQSVSSNTT
ncbi:MAG: hypothetical protein ABSE08_07685 [Syntrophobacteraceae bacterium]|jgi:hypothetical protein